MNSRTHDGVASNSTIVSVITLSAGVHIDGSQPALAMAADSPPSVEHLVLEVLGNGDSVFAFERIAPFDKGGYRGVDVVCRDRDPQRVEQMRVNLRQALCHQIVTTGRGLRDQPPGPAQKCALIALSVSGPGRVGGLASCASFNNRYSTLIGPRMSNW